MEQTRGKCIYWDQARGLLYFCAPDESLTFDEDEGVFRDPNGEEVSIDAVDTAIVRDQELLDEVQSPEDVRERLAKFISFKGFNEEAEYQLVEWED